MRQPTPHYASTGEIVTHKNHLAHNNFSVRGLRSHPTTLWNSESFNSHIILLRNRPQRGSFNFVIRSRDWTLHPHPRPESCLRVRPLGQPTRLRSASVKLGARLPKQAPLPTCTLGNSLAGPPALSQHGIVVLVCEHFRAHVYYHVCVSQYVRVALARGRIRSVARQIHARGATKEASSWRETRRYRSCWTSERPCVTAR